MCSQVDKDQLTKDCWVPPDPCTRREIEQTVVFVRLQLYNEDVPCGPKAIHKTMHSRYHIRPLPSEQTIARILARNGLTYGRTGWYEGENFDWLPESARRWNPYSQGVSG